jgi:hypothetical protein
VRIISKQEISQKPKKMKSLITTLLLVSFALGTALSQDDYKVIKVNGTIVLKTKGISLETGTVFSEKEDLLFRSEDATAAVINSQKGRLVLTNKNHDLSSARSNLLPSMYNISSRSALLSNDSDISTNFSGKYVVIDKQKIHIDSRTYPMDKDHFFFLRYLYKGEEINKKLAFSGDTLILEKVTLLTVDGNPIPSADNTTIKLFYRKVTESVFISEFDLIFPDMKQLSKETEIILSEIKDKPAKTKVAEIYSFLNDYYGKVQRENLTEWLETSFGVK